MAVTTFAKRRPKCRICGRHSHVITVANANSPMLGCCASCGLAARALAEWFERAPTGALERLQALVLERASDTAIERAMASGS